MFNVGIDIGGTTIKYGLFDNDNKLIDKWSIDTDISNDGTKIVPDLCNSLIKYLKEKNIKEINSIGITIPGPTTHGDKVVKAVNLNWKKEFNIAKEIKSHLNMDTYIYAINDANAAAYGEYVCGAGKSYDSIFMVTIGTGIGGALIFDDKLIEGTHGGAGEIGHLKVFDKYPLKCNCGGIGCLETIAAKNGIFNLFLKNIEEGKFKTSIPKKNDYSDFTIKDMCDRAKDGDELCKETIRESMYYIGKALSYVSEIVEPECMIIGGGIAKAGNLILDYIKDGYNKNSTMTSVKPAFTLAELQNDAGIYGAMLMAKKMKNIDKI